MKYIINYCQTRINPHTCLGLITILIFSLLLSCENKFRESRFDEEDEIQIMDYLDTNEDLSVFRDLIDYTGKRNLLKTAGSYTLFVPNNEAFEKLFARLNQNGKNISSIQDETKEFWLSYFNYHLLDKKINTNSLLPGALPSPTLLNNKYIIADIRDSYNAIKLNNFSTIVQYNLEFANGYINIINEVLNPPTETIYDELKSSGKYKIMLDLMEETGLSTFLKDSTITLLIENDEMLIKNEFRADDIGNLDEWLQYHIIPDSGYFMNQLTARRFYSLYPVEPLTFTVDDYGKYTINQIYKLDQSLEYGIDRVSMNGIFHNLDTVLQIEEAAPATIRLNCYPPGSPYGQQNVFAQAPARIVMNTGTRSYHQNKEFRIIAFDSQQVGDYFWLTFNDVPAGKYTIRMIHRAGSGRAKFLVIYNDNIVQSDVDLAKVDGPFEEYNYLSYNDFGEIVVESRSDVTLTFVMTAFAAGRVGSYCCDILLDIMELIPVIE
ncbi:MAG: fasciclin domain-containing protein [Parabacteroides sp.]|nr:fasciclin domain-containing protein [Parabacteroides sp.]